MTTWDLTFIQAIIFDGLFAAISAIGFAIISNPPRKALFIAALLAAVGHGLRYYLMHDSLFMMNIAAASFCAATSIGLLAIPFAKYIRCPSEIFAFPSLLPMVPGMFAYNSVIALTKFLQATDTVASQEYIIAFFRNGVTTVFVMFALVVGVSIPIFIFHRESFSVTRLLSLPKK